MIYLVSGMMRSGTSMLMACLEAGGMEVVRSEQRDRFSAAHADEHYQPNPSLYEPDLKDMRRPDWWREQDGKAVKCVVPWLGMLPVHEYRVLFLRRDAEEIRQSFEGAFGGRFTTEQIERQVEEGLLTLANRRDVTLTVAHYRDIVTDPVPFFQRLDWPIRPLDAASAVKPDLCRFKRELLTAGL